MSDDRAQALAGAETNECNYVTKMADAVASWATTRTSQYPGYETFVEKARAYDFRSALADRKVLAGTPEDVTDQLRVVRERYGDDLCVSLQFNAGHLPFKRAEHAMQLFADRVVPALAEDALRPATADLAPAAV